MLDYRLMKSRSNGVVIAVVLACPNLFAQSSPSELANFNRAWLAARNAGDKSSLDRMTTEDCRFTDDSGRVLRKTEFLKSAEPQPPDDQSRFEDVEIHGLGKDTAVMFVRLVETNRSLTGIGVEFREMKVFP